MVFCMGWWMRLTLSRAGGSAIPHPFPLPRHNTQALMNSHAVNDALPTGEMQPWLEQRGEVGCWGWAPAPQPLGLHSAAASRGGFVYLFHDYVYELPEFMRSEVKWKVTVHRSSERLKFVKPRKWQDSAKWKVKSQVKGSLWMKVSRLSAGQTTHPRGSTLPSSASKCSLTLIPWHIPGQEMDCAGITQTRLVVPFEGDWGWFHLRAQMDTDHNEFWAYLTNSSSGWGKSELDPCSCQ